MFSSITTKIIPPFNIKPAKIILANIGASTCTLGNHIWNLNVGILTIPIINKIKNKLYWVWNIKIYKQNIIIKN